MRQALVVLTLTGVFACSTLPESAYAQRQPEVYRLTIEPNWFAGNTRFWYRNDNPGGKREFIVVHAEKGTREPAFDHEAISRQIGGDKLPIETIKFSDDENTVELIGSQGTWTLDVRTGKLSELKKSAKATDRLPAESRVRPSQQADEETEITFENKIDENITIFWIDYSGNRQKYVTLSPGQTHDQHTFVGHIWLASNEKGTNAVFRARQKPGRAIIDGKEIERRGPRSRRRGNRRNETSVPSPDKKWEAFVKDHNLWVRNVTDESEKQISTSGNAEVSFHRSAIRDRAIDMRYNAADYPETLPDVYWSPDSTRIVGLTTHDVPEPRVTLIESSPADQIQPKLHSYPYIKPGDPIPVQQVHLFDVTQGCEIAVDNSDFATPWSLDRFQWSDDSSRCYFLYNQRGHQQMRVISLDAQCGVATTVVDETCKTFIDYSQKTYLKFLQETKELIWMSERSGWNHLYLYDLESGEVKHQITKGQWAVRRVDRVDEEKRQIEFRAVGIYPEQDPYHVHHCQIDFDGSNLILLTEGDGTHTVRHSPDRRYMIDTWSRVDQPPVHELRSSNGSLVCELDKADAEEVLQGGLMLPERFSAPGRDGQTAIFGIIHRPRDFKPGNKYPVIESIYAGPHGQFVPKSFRKAYRKLQEIADEGFIVVQIDGMGTNWRSKKFHDIAWKNLADAGFPDRIVWMKAAAATRPWMDITRVGIYGGSAGGQNAMRAVLDHADFYYAAVADCGCHDNRMDKIWWNEAWLGWPVDESYQASSNVEDAHLLGGKLLLTVGELDRNVDPSSTLQVADALRKADKEFELFIATGAGHGAGESDYLRRKRIDFFKTHLFNRPE